MRLHAVVALRELGYHSTASIDLLVALLRDSHSSVRYNAAYALGEVGYKSEHLLESLTISLEDSSVDSFAAEALGKLGLYSEKSVNLMFPLLLTDHFGVQEKVESALIKLGKLHQQQFLPQLLYWIEQQYENGGKINAVNILWEIIGS